MEAEVGSGSSTCNIIENAAVEDTRVGKIECANADQIHNPTIAKQAEELKKLNKSGTYRSLFCTFWCNSIEERNAEFERVCNVWQSTAKYIYFGAHETTEENKKPHCHCVFCFNGSKKWTTILKVLNSTKYHIEGCRNVVASIEYAWKDNTKDILEYGNRPKQGARTDLKKLLVESEHDPKKARELNLDLYSRYRNGFKEACQDYIDDKNVMEFIGAEEDESGNLTRKQYQPAKVLWLFGDTGAGKTKRVKDELFQDLQNKVTTKDKISIINKIENGFFIGTIRHETDILVLDEFRGSSMKYSDLLSLIDGCVVNVKGGQKYIKAKKIYITSCFSPHECYQNLAYHDSIDQLLRRIEVEELRNDEQ